MVDMVGGKMLQMKGGALFISKGTGCSDQQPAQDLHRETLGAAQQKPQYAEDQEKDRGEQEVAHRQVGEVPYENANGEEDRGERGRAVISLS
jgi:hypothetical protein